MLALLLVSSAAPEGDRVTGMPGFDFTNLPFEVYSGYLTVPGPFELNAYDSLEIHYQFHTSQGSKSDPVVTWHQGGPGGSSIEVGLYTEMGASHTRALSPPSASEPLPAAYQRMDLKRS